MATASGTSTPVAQRRAASQLPGQLAVMETARAAWNLIGEQHLENFAVVGGTALLFYGAGNMTSDVDLAVTAESMRAFEDAARQDQRFTETASGVWEYKSSYDIIVEIDFLNKDGGGCLHALQGYVLFDGLPVATLKDLALSKGRAWVDRAKDKDLAGFEFVVREMVRKGMDFKGVGVEGREILWDVMEELRCGVRGREFANVVRTLL